MQDTPESHIRAIVKSSVHETLISLGFDPQQPQQMQAHILFLKELYALQKETKRDIRATLVRWAIPPSVLALWEWLQWVQNI